MARETKRRRLSNAVEAAAAAPSPQAAPLPASASASGDGNASSATGPQGLDATAYQAFAEEYHDIVEQWPLELKRGFSLMSEQEKEMQNNQNLLHKSLLSFVRLQRALGKTRRHGAATRSQPATPAIDRNDPAALFSAEERGSSPPPLSPRSQLRALASDIAKYSRKAVSAGEEKVQQANAMYETVDRHIHRLDSDLAKYEDSLVIGLRSGTLPSSEAPSLFAAAAHSGAAHSVGNRGGAERPSAAITAAAAVADDKSRSVRVDPRGPPPSSPQEVAVPAFAGPSRKRSQKPEIYCHCKRGSFGDMIACDNANCPTEWFHYECVGLKSAPDKGAKWFCKDCIEKLAIQPQRGTRQSRR